MNKIMKFTKMEKIEDIIFVIVVGTWAMASVFLLTPSAIKGLNVVAENVFDTSINVDIVSQHVTSSLCQFIVIATGLTIANLLSDNLLMNIVSAYGNGFSEVDIFAYSVNNTITSVSPLIEPIVTEIINPIKYTSLSDSIRLDLILLNELKVVSTVLNSPVYDLLNNTILLKMFNHGFFFTPDYFKLGIEYGDFYPEVLNFSANPIKVYHNQPFLRNLYLKEGLGFKDIDYESYVNICGFENIHQAQAQLVEAMQLSCNLGTVGCEEMVLRNMFGLYLYSVDPTLFDASFIRLDNGRLAIATNFITFFDFSVVDHIIMEEDFFSYSYNIDLLLQKSKVFKAIIYLALTSR